MANTLRNDRKLIIFIDNLDRISTEKRLSFLSTLQTFLQYSHGDSKEYSELNHLWVVIPFNKNVIIDNDRNEYSQNGKRIISNENPKNQKEKQLLEKRIQFTFTVPKLLLSNWEEYLRHKLCEAFPHHNDDKTVGLIALMVKRFYKENPPKPRQIISFVNNIGALHRQWCPTIPLPHIACFVLLKNDPKLTLNEELLISEEYLNKDYVSLLFPQDQNLKDSILCLYFNAALDEARQLLLLPSIRASLINGDKNRLNLIIDNNHKTVAPYIDNIFSEHKKEEQSINIIYNLLSTIEESKAFDNQAIARNKEVLIGQIKFMVKHSKKEITLTKDSCEKASFLIDFFSEEKETINDIVRTINKQLTRESSVGIDSFDENVDSAVSGYKLLIDSLKRNTADIKDIKIFMATTEEQFFSFLQGVYDELGLDNTENITYFSNKDLEGEIDFNSVFTFVENAIIPFKRSILGAFQMLEKLRFDYDKNLLCSNLSKKVITELEVEETNETYPSSTNNILDAILYLSSTDAKRFADFIASLNGHNNGLIIRAIEKNYKEDDFKNCARWLYVQFRCFPDDFVYPTTDLKEYDIDFIEHFSNSDKEEIEKVISELRIFFEAYDFEVTNWFEKIEVKPEIVRLLHFILKEFNSFSREKFDINLDWMYSNWEIFRKRSNEEKWKIKFIKLLSNDYLIEDKIMQRDFEINQSQFFAHLIEFNFKQKFFDHCKEALQSISKEDWDNYFLTQHSVFLLLFYPNRRDDITPALTKNFQKSFIEFAAKFIRGEATIKYDKHWYLLYKSLHQHKRKSTCDEIFKIIEERNGNIPIDFFVYYGPLLIHEGALRARDCKFMRIFTPLIRNGDEKPIQWILEIFEKCNFKRIATDDSDTIHEFVDEIKNKLEDDITPENIKALLHKIYDRVDNTYKTDLNNNN